MENTFRKNACDKIVLEDGMIIKKSTGEVVGPEVDYTCCKKKF